MKCQLMWRLKRVVKICNASVHDIFFHVELKAIIALCEDGFLRVVSYPSFEILREIKLRGDPTYNMDIRGERCYVGNEINEQVGIYNLKTGEKIGEFSITPGSNYLIHFGHKYIICGGEGGYIKVISPDNMQIIKEWQVEDKGYILALVEQSNLIFAGTVSHSLYVYDFQGSKIQEYKKHNGKVIVIGFWQDYVVTGGNDHDLHVWDYRTQNLYHNFKSLHKDVIFRLIIVGNLAFSLDTSGQLVITDLKEKKILQTIMGFTNWYGLTTIPQVDSLLIGTEEGTIIEYEK